MNIKKNFAMIRIIQGILFAYPVLLLTVKGSMSVNFILMSVLCIYVLFNAEKGSFSKNMDRDAVMFSLAMSATFVCVLLSQLYHLEGSARAFDSPSRLLFSIPIFYVLRNINFKEIGIVQYGFLTGAILIGFVILASGQLVNARSYFNIHIHLGDLALMLGFLSIFSINWVQRDTSVVVAAKWLGLLGGLYVSLVSSARGGWAAIPLFILMWILMSPKFKTGILMRLSIAVALIALGVVLSYYTLDIVRLRLDVALNDLSSSNPDTSLGVRFQLWKAAVELFMQHPVFGVGAEGFGPAMDKLADSGVITKVAAEIGKGEVHSYYFATLARFGIIGLISTILLFVVPLRLFYKATLSNYTFHQVAGKMGMVLVAGFAVFCVTVEMFNLKMIATFYGMTIAILLAAATNRTVNETPLCGGQQVH